ncbi:MAG: signal recognition particle-docking protein FtsY [Thermoplasmata archaeon M8B2D]|nr:MAG: signal recognition particle-docking protein FtsY [Thermoplasmata archaeon M8B2D]
MFKFLKKKLKIFEDKLEEEIETELSKEIEIEKPAETAKPKEKPSHIFEKKPEIKEKIKTFEKTIEKPLETEIEEKKPEIKVEEKPIVETRRERVEHDRQKRQKEIDKQIEKTIEAELEHTLRTRKSIGEIVKTEKKSTLTISDEKLDDLLWDLEIGLLESDVAYSVIESIKKDIKNELKNASIERGKIGEVVESVLKNAISHVLKSNELDFKEFLDKNDKPIVIMFIGVNGSGKTLTIAKIATMLKKIGYSSVMAAGDTFRAGAIEQLSIHAEKVGVKIIKHGPGADPAAVAYDAIDHAKAKHKDVVLLDTAGRVQTNINLMDEMAKIKRVAKPDLIVFVGDALSGNDAVDQAKRFNEVVGIDGVILTKVDTDAKGGSALSVAYTIGKPLLFIGIGQGYEDQIPFDPEWMIKNIFGKEEQ